MTRLIYKIVPEELWSEAERKGIFEGAPVDLQDGFIHFSTAGQLAETARRHFSGQTGLVLAAVDDGLLGEALKYEPSRGGDLFPHLYAPLRTDDVAWARPIETEPDGTHILPEAE
jgi:uncharacterized protein (DUF952 family)